MSGLVESERASANGMRSRAVEAGACQLGPVDAADRAGQIIEHRKLMEDEYASGVRSSLWHALQSGVLVQREKASAPRGDKTEAVERLAANPDIGLSVAQLYRYAKIVTKLPQKLGLSHEEAIFLLRDKNAFLPLLGSLSLADAWRLICDDKAPSLGSRKKPTRRIGKKKKVVEEEVAAEHGSLHLFCDPSEIADAIASLQERGFEFHSVEVGCDKSGALLFLVSGVHGDALPAASEFGPWFQSLNDGLDFLAKQFTARVIESWPYPTIESYTATNA
jgi:hypothetical protein